eukprot:scaffold30909_cov80-Skeletonema_marinoi.AAC.1
MTRPSIVPGRLSVDAPIGGQIESPGGEGRGKRQQLDDGIVEIDRLTSRRRTLEPVISLRRMRLDALVI